MATAGFFNTNQYRDYPFVTRLSPMEFKGVIEGVPAAAKVRTKSSKPLHYRSFTALWLGGAELVVTPAMDELPQLCIVDFGAIVRPSADFRVDYDAIVLWSIAHTANQFTFKFVLSSMSLTYAIDFVVDLSTADEFHTQWADSPVLAHEDTGIFSCDDAPVWSAYLVTGDLTPLYHLIPDGGTLVFATDLWRVIPGRIQSLVGAQVQSIAIANTQRTTTLPPVECDGSSIGATLPPTAHVVDSCIVGHVTFHEGYNCSMRHDLRENAIIIAASVGSGAGSVCEEVPRYDGEPPHGDSPYLSGGQKCEDIVKYVNGVNASDLKIIAGAGFIVAADPLQPNTLVIERSLNASIICADPTLDSESLGSSSLSISLPPIFVPGPVE